MGRTCLTLIGGFLSTFSHHTLNGSSTVTYIRAFGGGASAKSLLALTPYLVVMKGSDGSEYYYVRLFEGRSICMRWCYRYTTGWGSIAHKSCFLRTVYFNQIGPDEGRMLYLDGRGHSHQTYLFHSIGSAT